MRFRKVLCIKNWNGDIMLTMEKTREATMTLVEYMGTDNFKKWGVYCKTTDGFHASLKELVERLAPDVMTDGWMRKWAGRLLLSEVVPLEKPNIVRDDILNIASEYLYNNDDEDFLPVDISDSDLAEMDRLFKASLPERGVVSERLEMDKDSIDAIVKTIRNK